MQDSNPGTMQASAADLWPGDFVQPFQIERAGLRGRLVRIGPALEKALAPHDYPPLVAQLLGETVAIALVLASGLKYDGMFTLQTSSDGPIGVLMADVSSDGDFRCYARYDADRVAEVAATDSAPSLPRLLGKGHIAFTVDQGPDTERHQGITEITGGSLVDCAHNYFRQSEQTLTALSVAADPGGDTAPSAGVVMIQRMPSASPLGEDAPERDLEDEDWRRSVILMGSVTPQELLDTGLAPQDLLFRLFHEDGVRMYTAYTVSNVCRCSDDRVGATLRSLRRSELDEMADDGVITVTCEFCKTDYVYDEDALDALFNETTH
ncbi:MAG: Hsp33 family molecular chaperone HslO [Rhodospirillales bacterium]